MQHHHLLGVSTPFIVVLFICTGVAHATPLPLRDAAAPPAIADTIRAGEQPDTSSSDFWSALLRALNKLSGPGPSLGVGIDADLVRNVTLFGVPGMYARCGILVSSSLENGLSYDSVWTKDSANKRLDSVSNPRNRTVFIVSLQPSIEWWIPSTAFRVGATGGVHLFVGDAYTPFVRASIGPHITYRGIPHLVLGLVSHFFPVQFQARDFGAWNWHSPSWDWVPELYASVRL